MLKRAGIESTLLLAHSRDEGTLTSENPCLWPMNAPVVRVTVEDKTFFCAPTTELVPFGYLRGYLQGAYALEARAPSKGLITLPSRSASEEATLTDSQITLSADGSIRVMRVEHPHGQSAIGWRKLSKLKPEELEQRFARIVASIHAAALLLRYSAENLKDLDKPVVITYEYEVAGYALKAGEETLVFKLPEVDYSASAIQKYERDLPMFWKTRYMLQNKATVTLPEGFKVTSKPPETVSYKEKAAFMWYEACFKEEDGRIYFGDTFVRNSVYEPPEAYPAFIAAIKTSAELAKQWIVIEKTK